MGEAKRRKQKLGLAYGKKQPPLNTTPLRDLHLDRFLKASTTFMDQIFGEMIQNPEDATLQQYFDKTQGELVDKLRAWLDNYLSGYEPQDRKALASTHIITLLNLFDEATDVEKGEMAFPLPIICMAYQPYLEEELAEVVEEFLADTAEFQQMLLEEEQEMLQEEE